MALGDATGARDDLTAALTANSEVPDAYLALARLYDGELADPAKARRYYRTLLDRYPDDEHAGEIRARLAELLPPS